MSVISIGKAVLRGLYGLHKLAPVKPRRVSIISRQSNQPSVDIRLLKKALEEDDSIDVRVLCRTLDGGIAKKIRYLCHMIGPQMHAIATSKVVVLDSYCIAISILHHKSELKVIQMWHAMGALKKFGKSILDQEEGSSRALAKAMDMHRGYDLILTSSESSRPFFAEAFGYPESVFWVRPLPRTDLLRDPEYMAEKREEILAKYPQLQGKKVILYAPTMRRTGEDAEKPLELAAAIRQSAAHVMVFSPHPVVLKQYKALQEKITEAGAVMLPEYSTLDLLSVCDVFVSDYSAVVYEAAVARKPIYLYAYDLEDYMKTRGFYLDYADEMPGPVLWSSEETLRSIQQEECNPERILQFEEKYIDSARDNTAALVQKIKDYL